MEGGAALSVVLRGYPLPSIFDKALLIKGLSCFVSQSIPSKGVMDKNRELYI
jgi:hypothetical protein